MDSLSVLIESNQCCSDESIPCIEPAQYVINRHGKKMAVQFDMITERNKALCQQSIYGKSLPNVDLVNLTERVIARFKNGITTREIDYICAQVCQEITTHPDYQMLAAKIYINDLHKRTPINLNEMIDKIMTLTEDKKVLRLSDELISVVSEYSQQINQKLEQTKYRDYRFNLFGYLTLSKSYLLRVFDKKYSSKSFTSLNSDIIIERPCHFYMRIALGIYLNEIITDDSIVDDVNNMPLSLQKAFKFYDVLSLQLVSQATPTLLNAGMKVPQMSSCFQLSTGDDLNELFSTVKSCGLISKLSGGISLILDNVRGADSVIHGTGGIASGLSGYLQILDKTQLYVDQGGNRKGAFAAYLSIDHVDLFDFLAAARIKGDESTMQTNAPNLKYGLMVSDLFMRTMIAATKDPNVEWYLFSPDDYPDLYLTYGEEYEGAYIRGIEAKKYRKSVKMSAVISELFKTWSQTGNPYILFKDNINHKSNLSHVAPIRSSNLCCEVLIPTWSNYDVKTFQSFNKDNTSGEFGVCNLGAICLENFVADSTINYHAIIDAAALECEILNKVIDMNFNPTPECERSNKRHRPIGIGLMGLADVFAKLKIAYGSERSIIVARSIAAAVYYGAMTKSHELASVHGSFPSFKDSSTQCGWLQPDMWVTNQDDSRIRFHLDPCQFDWNFPLNTQMFDKLRENAKKCLRNCYVTAYMPTATTSNICNQNECFEPFTTNVYTRKTLVGEFICINKHLAEELGPILTEKMQREIIMNDGSIQSIVGIPEEIKERYKTARELDVKSIIDVCHAMAPFICQSMSMNLYFNTPDLKKILGALVYGWKKGLKTGMYYCHQMPASSAGKTTAVCTPDCSSCAL